MNKFVAITTSLLATAWSLQSFASSTEYMFNAPLYASEVNVDGSAIAAGDYLFNSGDSISGTFFYDPATAATAVNQTPTDIGPTGLYSYYEGAIQNLSASVAGHALSATSGAALVGDGNAADGTLDSVYLRSGQFSSGNFGSGLSGFAINGYNLISFGLYTYDPPTQFDSQALPTTLAPGAYVTAVNLVFADANNNQRRVQFQATQLNAVPLPASAWLFGSATLALFARKRKRA